MKKISIILISLIMMIGLIGCIGCDDKPSKRAYFHNNGGLGMQYHITIYEPYGQLSHAVGCTKYEYIPLHIYTDNLGIMKGDAVVWKNPSGDDMPFSENGEDPSRITLNISKNSIIVHGFKSKNTNGKYKVKNTAPAN